MSFNVPKDMLEISSTLTLNVDLHKLGQRSINSLVKQLRTGVIESYGPASRIAKHIRDTNGSDYVHYWGKYNRLHYRLSSKEAFNRIESALVATKIINSKEESKYYYTKSLEKVINEISAHKRLVDHGAHKLEFKSYWTGMGTSTVRNAFKGFSIPCPECELIASKIERGEIRHISVDLYGGEEDA